MRRAAAWAAGAIFAVACALPEVDTDPSLTPGAGGTGAGSGGGGSKGGSPGRGGSGSVAGDAGAAAGDERETACGDYCTTYLAACGDFEANTYDDLGDCLTTCFTSEWPLGTDTAQVNSVQCRVVHAHLAETVGQDPHCFHSAEFPSGKSCAPP
jgi:hypothetical protein